MKPILTIAGSDCIGGAGLQADIKTFSAHGLYGMSAVTTLVAESTCEVISVHDVPALMVADQLDGIFSDVMPLAVKIGMLSNEDIMKTIAVKIKEYKPKNVVLDPVMYAKNGYALLSKDLCDAFKKHMFGIADVLTPNLLEASELCGFEINDENDMKNAALKIAQSGIKAVLIKGGSKKMSDFLLFENEFYEFKTKFVDTKNTNGTGCTLSSAIASNLALGFGMVDSIKNAKNYIQTAIDHSFSIGKGYGSTHHFYDLYQKANINDN